MKRLMVAVAVLGLFVPNAAFAQKDEPGSKDYPGISRMPGFYIIDYKETDFDSYAFPVTQKGQTTKQDMSGRSCIIVYERPDSGAATSRLQIVRNLQNAARAAGGEVLDSQTEDPGLAETTFRLVKGGKEVWVRIEARTNTYKQVVVEKEAMKQDVVMAAAAMGGDLAESGRVAIYGIYFDTAKAELKPESQPTLTEIAKLLRAHPELKVYIVGHTDMAGEAAANVKLSQARAESVVKALVTNHQVAAARLVPFGAGPYSPVASNKTEEGRAKNRRVELVEIATR